MLIYTHTQTTSGATGTHYSIDREIIEIGKDLKNQVDVSAQVILVEWEDAVYYQHSTEGVNDGMGMLKEINRYLQK